MSIKYSILKAKHIKLGVKGENIACKMLKAKGYDILHRNYRVKKNEIDIIARDGGVLCFIEVKTRHLNLKEKKDNFVWVRKRQTERIERAAKDYLFKIAGQKLKYRFELIELNLTFYSIRRIKHWSFDFGRSAS